jgi:hypothetical protein
MMKLIQQTVPVAIDLVMEAVETRLCETRATAWSRGPDAKLEVEIISPAEWAGSLVWLPESDVPPEMLSELPSAIPASEYDQWEGTLTWEKDAIRDLPSTVTGASIKLLGFRPLGKLWLPESGEQGFDPKSLLNDFLRTPKRLQSLLKFLQSNAIWSRQVERPRYGRGSNIWLRSPSFFWREQETISNWVEAGQDSWFRRPNEVVSLHMFQEFPYLRHEVKYVRDAIRLLLTIDFLAGAEFYPCAIPECLGFANRKRDRRRRFFCSLACAHRASSRRIRAKPEPASGPNKPKAARAKKVQKSR